MKNYSKNSFISKQTGFTLIEVLVTVAVTGILTALAAVVFINTVRNSKKAEIIAEARQNAALVIDRLQKDARGAQSLNSAGNSLTIFQPGGEILWQCIAQSGNNNGYITRDPDGSSGARPPLTVTNRDNVDGVSVNSCNFFSGGATKLSSFTFKTTEGAAVSSGPQEFGVDLDFQTSISTRQ